jgi:ribonuclease HII
MLFYEKKLWSSGFNNVAGIDEAGRGPLAGPVVAASVILPVDYFNNEINDSKKLTLKKREKLFDVITHDALSYGIGVVDNFEIDRINILQATMKAMQISINNLEIKPDYILVDGNHFFNCEIDYQLIIKGDSKSLSIAAASILAKVTRDRLMDYFTVDYPEYNFSKHKGYGTKEHIHLIKKFGKSPIHRKSFLVKGIDY